MLLVYGLEEWIAKTNLWDSKGLDQFEAHITLKLRKLEKDIWILITKGLWEAQAFWDGNQLSDVIFEKTGFPQREQFKSTLK